MFKYWPQDSCASTTKLVSPPGIGETPESEHEPNWTYPRPRHQDPMITISNEMSNGSHAQKSVNGKEDLNVIPHFKVIFF